MTKKIIITVGSLILFVYAVFFGDYFDLNFTEVQSETLLFLFKVYLSASLISFILSEIFKNYSQVDKLWSTIPIFYVWYFTLSSGFDSRMILMSIMVSIWGLRLTYNFARRGGYSIYFWKGEEDYRWKELKRKVPFLRPKELSKADSLGIEPVIHALEELPDCKRPLHVIAFDQDMQTPPAKAKLVSDAAADGYFHLLTGMGHCSLFRHMPKIVSEKIREIISLY